MRYTYIKCMYLLGTYDEELKKKCEVAIQIKLACLNVVTLIKKKT